MSRLPPTGLASGGPPPHHEFCSRGTRAPRWSRGEKLSWELKHPRFAVPIPFTPSSVEKPISRRSSIASTRAVR